MKNHPAKFKADSFPVHPQDAIIYVLAEKYGVSKTRVMLIMSMTGNNAQLTENMLKKNRFVR